MVMGTLLSYLAVSVVGSVVAGFLVHPLLVHWNVIDKPNERSSHTCPTARGGGVGFMAVILLGGGGWLYANGHLLALAVLSGAAFLAVVSFADDICSLPAGVRFGCHGLVAGVAIWFLFRIGRDRLTELLGTSMWLHGLVAVALFLWIAGYTNAFNFMDGINGISGMQGGFASLGALVVVAVAGGGAPSVPSAMISTLIAGACLGFLPHNFPKARMFMGDVGSAPLGYLLAVTSVWLALETRLELLVPIVLLHANYVLDTGFTLCRRVLRGDKWYAAHREHFYQRLIRSGWSHSRVTFTEATLLLLSIAILASYSRFEFGGRLCLIGAVLVLWLCFFVHAERVFRHVAK